jgi:hypothetical protein
MFHPAASIVYHLNCYWPLAVDSANTINNIVETTNRAIDAIFLFFIADSSLSKVSFGRQSTG